MTKVTYTLKYRRTTGDMIEVYKILTDKYDNNDNLGSHNQRTQFEIGPPKMLL